MRRLVYLVVFGVLFFFTLLGCEKDQPKIQQDREEVVMRKIGHHLLLNSNDSISRVLPIVWEEDSYRIQFESGFSFLPDDLVRIIDSIVKIEFPEKNYLVQVVACDSNQVVYSYEVDVFSSTPFPDGIACTTRPQPEDCYEVVIQFTPKEDKSVLGLFLFVLSAFLTLLVGGYFYHKHKSGVNDEKIKIGTYLFDSKKMLLIRQEKIIELTSKENELLSLLYQFVNETVNKETILNKVWEDEGDYVGRTLDVYVSKLRKKLESDPSIQLKNIRGIGYKLIIED